MASLPGVWLTANGLHVVPGAAARIDSGRGLSKKKRADIGADNVEGLVIQSNTFGTTGA